MKKTSTILLSVILCVVMLAAFAGCNSEPTGAAAELKNWQENIGPKAILAKQEFDRNQQTFVGAEVIVAEIDKVLAAVQAAEDELDKINKDELDNTNKAVFDQEKANLNYFKETYSGMRSQFAQDEPSGTPEPAPAE